MKTETTSAVHTLFDLRNGDVARIKCINGGEDAGVRRRLVDMGLTKGAVFCVDRHAPLGDPVQINIKGYRLAVRLREARKIEVDLIRRNGAEETA